jgi:hypothetical protein
VVYGPSPRQNQRISIADSQEDRIAALETKVKELDALVSLALRLIAVKQPVSDVLKRYGATEAEDRAVHALLDDMAKRVDRDPMYAPSFAGFVGGVVERFPAVRDNREFTDLLLDTLKLDRPAYQKLHAHLTAQNWPK